jgi:hypothetical protein
MKEGDHVRLKERLRSDGGRTFDAGTDGWITDVQGGGAAFVVEITLDDGSAPLDLVYAEAAQLEPVST